LEIYDQYRLPHIAHGEVFRTAFGQFLKNLHAGGADRFKASVKRKVRNMCAEEFLPYTYKVYISSSATPYHMAKKSSVVFIKTMLAVYEWNVRGIP